MSQRLKFHVNEKLSARRAKTKEGFLLCYDVPINRTGDQMYGPGETPVEVCPQRGFSTISREAKEVFKKETLESFNGKPVIIRHIEEVNPDNWSQVVVGVVLNVRKGEGILDDATVADLMICDKAAIELIERDEMREVSCGYECDYEDFGGGKGKQYNIFGNHVALVERARCGSRCAIGDEATTVEEAESTEGDSMLKNLREKISQAFEKKDKKALDEALAEIPDEGKTETHIHVHTKDAEGEERASEPEDDKDKDKTKDKALDAMDGRIKKLEDGYDAMSKDIKSIKDAVTGDEDDEDEEEDEEEEVNEEGQGNAKDKKAKAKDAANKKLQDSLAEEAPEGQSDKARKAKDSAYLVDSFKESVALAEIIVPGVQVPSYDEKADPKKTFDSLCQFRRTVLQKAQANDETREVVESLTRGRALDSLTCDSVRNIFFSVGTVMKSRNRDAATARSNSDFFTAAGSRPTGKVRSIAELNKLKSEQKYD